VAYGSCPFLFAQDRRTGAWRNLGTVLAGRSSADRYGHDQQRLRSEAGRLQLRELEAETSYVDRAALEIRAADGTRRVLPAADPLLRAEDGRYLVLRRGEAAELEFPGAERLTGSRVLHVWGYYLEDRPSGPRRRGSSETGASAPGQRRRPTNL
jgi:hypothetical protein